MTEVPRYDILTAQAAREQDILADYAGASYAMLDPYVIVDPYDMNPLSALVLFDSAGAGSVTVTVQGDNAASTLRYVKSLDPARAEVPILGLYAGRDTHRYPHERHGRDRRAHDYDRAAARRFPDLQPSREPAWQNGAGVHAHDRVL